MSEAYTQPIPETAATLIAAIAQKRLSAVDVATAALDRAKALSHLNAFITLNAEAALETARRVDAGEISGPLAGLPIVIKDNINVAGLPTSAATPALQRAMARANAPCLQKLLDAGAILIGKTNMHELAFGITNTNFAPFAGAVKNPYDVNRIPGGSSGGTAAAIAARIVRAGLGTDTGGSTRVPAALTGTVGLRPSVGNGGTERRYDNTDAVVPISPTRDTVGPMGLTVADVALLDSVITGTPLAAPIPLRGLRFGIPASFWSGLDAGLETVAIAARQKLAEAGVELVDIDIPGLFELNDLLSFAIALHEPSLAIPAYLKACGHDGITLADIASGIGNPDVRAAFEVVLSGVQAAPYEEAMATHRPALQRLYADYFAANRLDAMLLPTTILPAAEIDAIKGSAEISINGGPPASTFHTFIRNTDALTNAGLPGLSLFAGMTATGLPVGIEIDGPLGSDEKLLGIGLSMEAVLGTAPAPAL